MQVDEGVAYEACCFGIDGGEGVVEGGKVESFVGGRGGEEVV